MVRKSQQNKKILHEQLSSSVLQTMPDKSFEIWLCKILI